MNDETKIDILIEAFSALIREKDSIITSISEIKKEIDSENDELRNNISFLLDIIDAVEDRSVSQIWLIDKISDGEKRERISNDTYQQWILYLTGEDKK